MHCAFREIAKVGANEERSWQAKPESDSQRELLAYHYCADHFVDRLDDFQHLVVADHFVPVLVVHVERPLKQPVKARTDCF